MTKTITVKQNDEYIIIFKDHVIKMSYLGGRSPVLSISPITGDALYFSGYRPTTDKNESHVMGYMHISTIEDLKSREHREKVRLLFQGNFNKNVS